MCKMAMLSPTEGQPPEHPGESQGQAGTPVSFDNLLLRWRLLWMGVVHAYDPSIWEEEAGGGESEVSLGYITNSKLVCSTGENNSSKE